jgi:sugar lactone lactonase YvrE
MSIVISISQIFLRISQSSALSAAMIAAASGLLNGCGGLNAAENAKPFKQISIAAGSGLGEPYGIVHRDGEIFVTDGEGGRVLRLASGLQEIFATGLDTPSGIAFDADGNLIVADSGTNSIRKVGTNGNVTMVAGSGQRGSEDGNAGSATFSSPIGIAISASGAIYVADTYNDRIRVIENAAVRTIAGSSRGFADGIGSSAKFDTPLGLAAWHDKILVADAGNRRIRVLEPDGSVWTLAGDGTEQQRDGRPLNAAFAQPAAISVSPSGAIFVADADSIRVIGDGAFPFVTTIVSRSRGERAAQGFKATLSRPSGIAVDGSGNVFVSDSDNGVIRSLSREASVNDRAASEPEPQRISAEQFRTLAPPRWPYDPPGAARDIAGTLGEIRGRIDGKDSPVWFHNGLDIAGAYGERAIFIRDEKVLDPAAAENFGTLRELLRLPTLGYIHIRLGRDQNDRPLGDQRFLFDGSPGGKPTDVRVPRGSLFRAGDVIGTLNALNHVHLIAGRRGAEMNALAALELPGVADTVPPTIEDVRLFNPDWSRLETKSVSSRISISGNVRVVVTAFDRMDGNPERRKLGVFKLGYSLYPAGTPPSEPQWTIVFDRMPANEAVRTVYAENSNSGAYGGTVFNYIATNFVNGDSFGEGFIDTSAIPAGLHTIRIYVADLFGNTTTKDIEVEVVK